MGDLEVSNLLIVESHNDKYFIEALIDFMNLSNINVSEPLCSIDEYECIGGIGNLKKKLKEVKARVAKNGDIKKIGIIVDADNKGIEERGIEIENLISTVFSEDDEIEFLYYITNVEGFGELETVLKEIKKNDSIYADCLNAWQECLPEDKKIKKKDFDKFWVQIYQRYDCCSKKEAKQTDKKCNNEVSLKEKDIWNFEHEILNNLKEFLINLSKDNR